MTTLIVGMGSPIRGDDAAGLSLVASLQSPNAVGIAGDPLAVMDLWDGYDRVVIVDAMRSGRPPGTIARVDLDAGPTDVRFSSTHAMGPLDVLSIAQALDRLPDTVEVIGIEIGHLRHGADMSQPVKDAIALLAEELRDA